MNKAAVVITSVLVVGTGIAVGVNLAGKAKAATDLKLDFGALNLKSASVKDGILFDVIFKAANNSPVELKFTQPFVEVSIMGDKGALTQIAVSHDALGIISLAPRKVSDLKFNLSISPTQAARIPTLLWHFINNKVAVAFGRKPTIDKKLLLEFGFTAEGINFKKKQDVLV